MTGNAGKPVKVYRLWCGSRCHSEWLDSPEAVWELAFEKGLAFRNLNGDGGGGLGPLTWIERGTRASPRSRVVIGEPIGNVRPL